MCTPYKIEAFADNSRPGCEAGEYESGSVKFQLMKNIL